MEALRADFCDVARFVKVYVSEAHPVDGWKVYSDIDYCQPTTLEQRAAAARLLLLEQPACFPLAARSDRCGGSDGKGVGDGWTMLLDSMRDEAERLYAAHPERHYVVDPRGKIAFKGGMGPFGYLPAELRAFLRGLRHNKGAPPGAA